MAKRKDEKPIHKRRAKSKQKKTQKRQLGLVHSTPDKPDIPSELLFWPPISDVEAPEGFYTISMTQAMMKFAEPILEHAQPNDIDEMNSYLNLVMLIWNYTISVEQDCRSDEIKKEALDFIMTAMGSTEEDAKKFMDKMIKRREYLLPPEIQPKGTPHMYIRKEMHHIISRFNYDKLNIVAEPILLTAQDVEFIENLNKMDRFIIENADYGDWENFYLELEDECRERFRIWLVDKGLSKYAGSFEFSAGMYLNFIYRYGHSDTTILKKVGPVDIEEFFLDHVLRKVMLKPNEYPEIFPAVKLFYQFLTEKGYIGDPSNIINLLDEIETEFLEVLQSRYR